jgi:hypothetical protein
MPPTVEQVETYWAKVRTLPVYEKQGGGSDGYRMLLIVDWSPAFAGTTRDSASFVLGFDPISREWIDDKAQFMSVTQWINTAVDQKISSLDARVKKLEGK